MRELRNCNEIVKMDSRTVEGYALVFGKQSRDLGGFTEVIEPTALEGILEKSDILCLLNHNEDNDLSERVDAEDLPPYSGVEAHSGNSSGGPRSGRYYHTRASGRCWDRHAGECRRSGSVAEKNRNLSLTAKRKAR